MEKVLYGDMRRYKRKRENRWKYRLFSRFNKHSQEVIRRFPSIKSIKNYHKKLLKKEFAEIKPAICFGQASIEYLHREKIITTIKGNRYKNAGT